MSDIINCHAAKAADAQNDDQPVLAPLTEEMLNRWNKSVSALEIPKLAKKPATKPKLNADAFYSGSTCDTMRRARCEYEAVESVASGHDSGMDATSAAATSDSEASASDADPMARWRARKEARKAKAKAKAFSYGVLLKKQTKVTQSTVPKSDLGEHHAASSSLAYRAYNAPDVPRLVRFGERLAPIESCDCSSIDGESRESSDKSRAGRLAALAGYPSVNDSKNAAMLTQILEKIAPLLSSSSDDEGQ